MNDDDDSEHVGSGGKKQAFHPKQNQTILFCFVLNESIINSYHDGAHTTDQYICAANEIMGNAIYLCQTLPLKDKWPFVDTQINFISEDPRASFTLTAAPPLLLLICKHVLANLMSANLVTHWFYP